MDGTKNYIVTILAKTLMEKVYKIVKFMQKRFTVEPSDNMSSCCTR